LLIYKEIIDSKKHATAANSMVAVAAAVAVAADTRAKKAGGKDFPNGIG